MPELQAGRFADLDRPPQKDALSAAASVAFVGVPGMTTNEPAVREVSFEGGNRAPLVTVAEQDGSAGVLYNLGLAPGRPVIVLVGGAVPMADDPLTPVCRLPAAALVRAAGMAGAVILDGTTDADAMAEIGSAYADAAETETSTTAGAGRGQLLGVAPAGQVLLPGETTEGHGDRRVRLERNHSHFALAAGDQWGAAARLLVRLAGALADAAPVVMVLAGGGAVARAEALDAVRHGWPLFVIEGSGGTADDVAQWWHTSHAAGPPARARARWRRGRQDQDQGHGGGGHTGTGGGALAMVDPALAKIVERGDLRFVEGAVVDDAALARLLAWELQDAAVLKLAWERFARYQTAATRLRRTDDRLQRWPLALGIAAVLVALVQHAVQPQVGANSIAALVLHWTVAALPLLLTVLLVAGHRLGAGRRWPLLRAAAEAARREIYRYRAAARPYDSDASEGEESAGANATNAAAARDAALAERLGAIDAGLMHTEIAVGRLSAYSGPLPPPSAGTAAGDDGLSPLDPRGYLELRLAERLSACRARVTLAERRLRRLQLLVLAAGIAGSTLAIVGLELWVGLSTAILAAAVAYLAHLQVDNHTATRLEAARARWLALPAAERDAHHFAVLVDQTEAADNPNLSAWTQQLAEAIAAARALAATASPLAPEGGPAGVVDQVGRAAAIEGREQVLGRAQSHGGTGLDRGTAKVGH